MPASGLFLIRYDVSLLREALATLETGPSFFLTQRLSHGVAHKFVDRSS